MKEEKENNNNAKKKSKVSGRLNRDKKKLYIQKYKKIYNFFFH